MGATHDGSCWVTLSIISTLSWGVTKKIGKYLGINELFVLTTADSGFLKDSELPIFADGPPPEIAPVHGHINPVRQRLDKR